MKHTDTQSLCLIQQGHSHQQEKKWRRLIQDGVGGFKDGVRTSRLVSSNSRVVVAALLLWRRLRRRQRQHGGADDGGDRHDKCPDAGGTAG